MQHVPRSRIELGGDRESAFFDKPVLRVFFVNRFGQFFFECGGADAFFGTVDPGVEVAFGVQGETARSHFDAVFFVIQQLLMANGLVLFFVVELEYFFFLVDPHRPARVDRDAVKSFEFRFEFRRFDLDLGEFGDRFARRGELVDAEIGRMFFFFFRRQCADHVHIAFGRIRRRGRVVHSDIHRIGHLEFAHEGRLAFGVELGFELLDTVVAAIGHIEVAGSVVNSYPGGVLELAGGFAGRTE